MPSPEPAPAMGAAELARFAAESSPDNPPRWLVEESAGWGVRLRLPGAEVMTRPGGTVAGPTIMALADSAAWLAVLGRIGPVALAVTTSLHIDFLRRPLPVDLVAEGRLLKLGRRLAVVDVLISSAGSPDPVAKAQVTYAIPDDCGGAPPRD